MTIIKPADKGEATVIQNKQDYIQEELRQCQVDKSYSPMEEDPIRKYNVKIIQHIRKATNLNIVDKNKQKTPYKKCSRIPNCYILPKIHKANNWKYN